MLFGVLVRVGSGARVCYGVRIYELVYVLCDGWIVMDKVLKCITYSRPRENRSIYVDNVYKIL